MIKVKGLDFDECFKLSKIFEADGLSIRTLHLNNLIQAKKEAGRLKDLDDIQQLTKNKILSFVNILVANAVDAEMIADLSYRTFYDAFGPFNTKENMDKFIRNDFNRKKLISQISEPGNIFLLAYQHDELTGYVRLFESHNPPELGETDAIEISRIYVENKITSKGIGSALMQKCIDVAQEKNKKIIWLGVWEHNARAIAFYKKWGFEIFGDHIFMLGDDAQTDVLMKKNL
jgi:ribosomal protein S18 acetylase RimI-like enzyme